MLSTDVDCELYIESFRLNKLMSRQKAGLDDIPWDCPYMPRRFGDAGSFRLTFDDKPDSSNPVRFPFEEPEWIMGGPHCGGDCRQLLETSVVPWAPRT